MTAQIHVVFEMGRFLWFFFYCFYVFYGFRKLKFEVFRNLKFRTRILNPNSNPKLRILRPNETVQSIVFSFRDVKFLFQFLKKVIGLG